MTHHRNETTSRSIDLSAPRRGRGRGREREIEEENLSKEMTYMCSHGLVVYGAGKSTDRISAGSSVFCQDVLLALALAPSQARASTAKYEQGFSLLNYSATEVTIPLIKGGVRARIFDGSRTENSAHSRQYCTRAF